MKKILEIIICLVALAAIPAALWLTAPRENLYPGQTTARRALSQGLDALDVDPNVPMDHETAVERLQTITCENGAAPAEERLARFVAAWSPWAQSPPDYDTAHTRLQDFLKRYSEGPLVAEAAFLLGLVMRNHPLRPDPLGSLTWFEKVVQMTPDSTLADMARQQLADGCRVDLRRPEAAAHWFEELFAKGEKTFQPEDRLLFRYLQGKVLEQAGRHDEAAACFKSMLDSDLAGVGNWKDRILDRLDELHVPIDPAAPRTAWTDPMPMLDAHYKPAKPVTISVSSWILFKSGMNKGFNEVVRRYEARNPGVKVKLIDLPYEGYHNWLQSQILGQEIPDIVQIDNGTAIRYGAYQGRLIDMTDDLFRPNPYTGRVWADMFWPQFIVDARDPIKRRNWVISWASESTCFIYNKDAFRKAGLIQRDGGGQPRLDARGRPLVAEPATWGELMTAFERLRQTGYYGEVCNFHPDPAPLIWQMPYLSKQIYDSLIPKLDVIVPDDLPDPMELARCMLDGSLDLREPRVSQLWRLLYEKSEYWVPGATSMDIREAFNEFAQGKAATIFWVSTDLPDLEATSNFEVGIFPFPSLEGTPYFDGLYSETPSLRAFEFAIPKVTRDRGTLEAAVDFLRFFTSPEAQQVMVEKADTLSPIRSVKPSERLMPFLRGMDRRGTHLIVFNPYEIYIAKEPYFQEARNKLLDELNALLGDIPNYDYYHKTTGGDRTQYQQWRAQRLDEFLGNMQKYFKWAYGRVVSEYSEDLLLEMRREQHKWIHQFRRLEPALLEGKSVDQDAMRELGRSWIALTTNWGLVRIMERMMPEDAVKVRYQPPALSLREARRLGRAAQVALATLLALLVLWSAWRGSLGRMLGDWRVLRWLLPTVALLALFNYFPASSAIYHAFFLWNGAEISEFIGLQNFHHILGDDVLRHSLVVMLIFIVANIIKLTPTILVAVVMFHLLSRRAQYCFRVIFVLPLIIPWIVYILLWKFVFKMDGGLMNALLMHAGLIATPINWLGNGSTVIPSLMLIGFPFVSTIGVLILLAGLQSIPESVFEAAIMDGCGVFRRFREIEMPLIMGQIKLNIVLITIQTVQDFALPLILTNGGPNNASMMPGLWMYLNAFYYGKMGYASALGVLMFLLILALTTLHMRTMKVHEE